MTGWAMQLLLLAFTLLVSSFLVYALTVLVPGDPALALFRARFGEGAPAERVQVEAIRQEAGFDRSIPEQYAAWLGRALQGDLGRSFTKRRPVMPLILDRLPVTLTLTLGALVVAMALAVPVSLFAARNLGRTHLLLAITQLGLAVPDYVLAIVLMLTFAVKLSLVPVSGWQTPAAYILPIATLAFRPWATFTRLLMAGLDETLGSDWVRTARAKGLPERFVLYRHALPHTLLPVISVLGASASAALAGGLVAEVIFAIPGVGRLLYEAIGERDIPTIQACLLIQVSLAILANWLADAASRQINPMLRFPR
ncbi:MAG: ABC transporter permease [Chloroflexi bacterium]|nr:ABC transporter permease [Chloroflexota bacterium]